MLCGFDFVWRRVREGVGVIGLLACIGCATAPVPATYGRPVANEGARPASGASAGVSIRNPDAPTSSAPLVDIRTDRARAASYAKALAVTDPGVLDMDAPFDTVVVKRGESLQTLGERYRMPVNAIILANNLQKPYAITEGMVLRLPPPLAYRVREGDSFMSLGATFRIDPHSLATFNKRRRQDALAVGETIYLPAGMVNVPKAAAAPVASPRAPGKLAKAPNSAVLPVVMSTPTAPVGASSPPFPVAWPVEGKLAVPFGDQPGGRRSDGIKIKAERGTPFRAVAPGKVIYANKFLPGLGNVVLVQHENGWVSAYAHADELTAQEGQKVKRGDVLGLVGSTGRNSEPMLHFELRRGSKPVDPMLALSGSGAPVPMPTLGTGPLKLTDARP